MKMLSDRELSSLSPAEDASAPTPLPVQVVSSDEFMPSPQTARQRQVEARLDALADEHGARRGLSRRGFFRSASGMAAAFVAMNEVYGPLYGVDRAEAAVPGAAEERLAQLRDEYVMDVHTHFRRDDTRLEGFARAREAVGKAGWNP
ncbi:MAG: amidohydrolase, partial [Alphaproteobacteria bacterium]